MPSPDIQGVYSASGGIHTGAGVLTAVIISTTSATGVTATFYDNTAGSGTKVLEAIITRQVPLVVFFSDRFAPRFATGLYVVLAAGMTVTVWAIGL